MILEIDIGNTSAKWRLLDEQQIISRGKVHSQVFPDALVCALKGVRRVRLASVISHHDTARVEQSLRSAFGLEVEVAVVAASQAGVTNGYLEPMQMGVDRWLAMLAAFNTAKRGCLVVSCGTAVTIDSILDSGVHEGGYILPGLVMMRTALLSGTGRIVFQPGEFGLSRQLGMSTTTAVEHGAFHAVLSAVERMCVDRVGRHGSCDLFLTGGDAQALHGHLDLAELPVVCHYFEDLVLNGLQYALP